MILKRRASEGHQRVNIRGKRRASEVNKTVQSGVLEKRKKANPQVKNIIIDFLSCNWHINQIQAQFQISILDCPNEILLGIYPHLDLSGRRGLRVNERMKRIEMEVEYHYRTLDILIVSYFYCLITLRTYVDQSKII